MVSEGNGWHIVALVVIMQKPFTDTKGYNLDVMAGASQQ